jgi:hypothetical protein
MTILKQKERMKMSETAMPFDPATFLDATLPGANSTKFEVIPAGTYRAFISDLEFKNGTVQKEGENYGKPWYSLSIKWQLEDEGLKAQLGRPTITAYQSLMLDVTSEGLDMGKGKNVRLGKLREAIGLNSGPVQFSAFKGRPATVQVTHDTYKGELVAQVTSVAKAS